MIPISAMRIQKKQLNRGTVELERKQNEKDNHSTSGIICSVLCGRLYDNGGVEQMNNLGNKRFAPKCTPSHRKKYGCTMMDDGFPCEFTTENGYCGYYDISDEKQLLENFDRLGQLEDVVEDIEFIDRQTPKKTFRTKYASQCPFCGKPVLNRMELFCSHCGQRFDWRDDA